jgi:outer membrane biosynthesis protein TonB
VTLIRSFTQSLSRFEATTISWTDAVTLTVTQFSETALVLEYQTRSAVALPTFVFSMIRLPVFIRTVVPVRVGFIFSPTRDSATHISTGVLLAVVTGAALVVAIFLGMVVFLVRANRTAAPSPSAESTPPLNESSDDTAPAVTEEPPPSHRPSVLMNRWSSSGSWSSIDDIENEDAGLYV